MTPDMQSSGVRYSGTKTLTAWPMTRGQYNSYRTWTPPEGEDQATAGYLVEYADGGAANDSRHAGYISWSPADVFDRSYKAVGTFQDRVRAERADLDERLDKLVAFRSTNTFAGLPVEEQERLDAQRAAMTDYSNVLHERIAAF